MRLQLFVVTFFVFKVVAIDHNVIPDAELLQSSWLWDKTVCGFDDLMPQTIKASPIAQFKELPWVAALEYYSKSTNKSAGIRCAGSLISDRFVLTAAHCIVHQELVVFKAWLGATNTSLGGNCLNHECVDSIQKRIVIDAFPHPSYNSAHGNNDIGLLRLGHKITFTEHIRPICLPTRSPSLQVGSSLVVAGWGTTKDAKPSDVKLKTEVRLQNNSLCNEYFATKERVISSEQVCLVGDKGTNSCQGNSGGPLMQSFTNADGRTQWYQYGLVAGGTVCGVGDIPAIYTVASAHFEWIFVTMHERNRPLQKDSTCETSDLRRGTCVSWYSCRKDFSAEDINGGDATEHCGFEYAGDMGRDRRQLVCCESPGTIGEPNVEIKALPDKTVCGVTKNERRSNGNGTAEPGEFPWVVGLAYKSFKNNNSAGIRCAGALISNRYVLASAFCLKNEEFEPVSVWLGDWKLTTDPDCYGTNAGCVDSVKKVPIKEIIEPTLFSEWRIALIYLENEIQFTDFIHPICLPSTNLPPLDPGTVLTVAGWGKTQNDFSSDILRKEEISLGSMNGCDTGVYPLKFPEQCTDSNTWTVREIEGPLMRPYKGKPSDRSQWHLVGLFVTPFKFIRVDSYVNWIANVMSKN